MPGHRLRERGCLTMSDVSEARDQRQLLLLAGLFQEELGSHTSISLAPVLGIWNFPALTLILMMDIVTLTE